MDFAPLGLALDDTARRRLLAALAAANGTRKVRLLEATHLVAAAAEALERGYAVRHGGEANDGTQRTTLCLAVRDGDAVTVGVGLSGAAGAGPGRTWQSLQPWSKTAPERNRARLEAWARARAADRVRLTVVGPRAEAPRPARSLEALLAAVIAEPDRDEPRAVLADAWIEQGDPRGEYVALRLATARRPDAAATRRADALEAEHGARWTEELRQFTLKQRFARGFVEEVAMRAATFATEAPRLFRLAPITAVVLRGADVPALRKVAAQPLVARLQRLVIDRLVKDPGARVLARAPLTHLRELGCGGCGFSTEAIAEVLAVAPALEWLHLRTMGASLADLVARHPTLRVTVTSALREPKALALETQGRVVRRPPRRS